MNESLILVERRDAVATLTLNRPQRRNALSLELLDAILEQLAVCKADPDIKVVVITGAGKAFCAGGDLGGQMPTGGLLALHDSRQRFVDLFDALFTLGKPTIARVNGNCLGGGFGLMLACDLAVASTEATFGTPEIKVGLFPMMIMTLIFRNIGRKRAMEMMLTGERVSPEEALSLGMINRVAAPEELDAVVAKLADRVASYSPAVLKLGRDAIYTTMDMSLPEGLQYLRSQLTLNTMSEDASEGIGAFLARRPPAWKGR